MIAALVRTGNSMENESIYSPPRADLDGTTAQNSSEETEYIDINLASRWARLGAALIDVLVLVAPYAVFIYGTDYWERALKQQVTLQEQALSVLVGFAIYLIVNGYILHKRGQTIGKWALGIKIVSVVNNEIIPLWKVFFIRYVSQVLVAMIPFLGSILIIVNDLFIFRKDRRCAHDHLAGTKVVKEYAH